VDIYRPPVVDVVFRKHAPEFRFVLDDEPPHSLPEHAFHLQSPLSQRLTHECRPPQSHRRGSIADRVGRLPVRRECFAASSVSRLALVESPCSIQGTEFSHAGELCRWPRCHGVFLSRRVRVGNRPAVPRRFTRLCHPFPMLQGAQKNKKITPTARCAFCQAHGACGSLESKSSPLCPELWHLRGGPLLCVRATTGGRLKLQQLEFVKRKVRIWAKRRRGCCHLLPLSTQLRPNRGELMLDLQAIIYVN